ncbi:alpha/beta-type small acid-soluble spore protein [Bacillus sp. JZ8]
MARRPILSNKAKEEIAKELGFYDTVKEQGYGAITSKDAGNIVKRAVEIAKSGLNKQV